MKKDSCLGGLREYDLEHWDDDLWKNDVPLEDSTGTGVKLNLDDYCSLWVSKDASYEEKLEDVMIGLESLRLMEKILMLHHNR